MNVHSSAFMRYVEGFWRESEQIDEIMVSKYEPCSKSHL
jgi:hypothetical protein